MTSGTRSLPSAPGWRRERSRFGKVERGLCDCGDEEKRETRDSDLRLKDWENLWIMSFASAGKEAVERTSIADRDEEVVVNVE